MQQIEVFADVACPFTHAGLAGFLALRAELGRREPVLRVLPWPLELVNDSRLEGRALVGKVAALQDGVAPDLFSGFSPTSFPASTLAALALEEAAYRVSPEVGEQCNAALRDAVFEQGLDVGDPSVLTAIAAEHGVPMPTEDDEAAVRAWYEEGRRRGVTGSPHFFTGDGAFFCPSLEIGHEGGGVQVSFDADGFRTFIEAVFDPV